MTKIHEINLLGQSIWLDSISRDMFESGQLSDLIQKGVSGLTSNPTILDNTISLHRKKQTNTLYTINALNELIMDINNGVLDTSYQIPWDVYKNMILISNKEGISRIPTRILKIINL